MSKSLCRGREVGPCVSVRTSHVRVGEGGRRRHGAGVEWSIGSGYEARLGCLASGGSGRISPWMLSKMDVEGCSELLAKGCV